MKQKDIKIGAIYGAKVTGKVVPVRIDRLSPSGIGWDATSLVTKRSVRVKTAGRLRRLPAKDRPADIAKAVDAIKKGDLAKGVVVPTGRGAAKKAGDAALGKAVAQTIDPGGKGRTEFAQHLDRAVAAAKQAPRAKKGKKATTKAKTPKPRATGKRGAATGKTGGDKPMSCLTAAVQVLKDRKAKEGPLSCPEMITRMLGRKYWRPVRGGKTPAATLYSAILREIANKGKASRFLKTSRGKFTLTKGA